VAASAGCRSSTDASGSGLHQPDDVSVWSLGAVPQTQTVWAAGLSGFAAVSRDGGATWSRRKIVNNDFFRVSFVSADVGWIAAAPGVIFRTTDGGSTWRELPTGLSNEPITSFHFVDPSAGWAAGNDGSIVATRNGGMTWTNQRSGAGVDDVLLDIRFIDTMRGWAVGSEQVLRTTNGGTTWMAQSVPRSAMWTNVFFANATHGWIVGESGSILHTVNGGSTWVAQRAATSATHFQGIVAGDELHALAVGIGPAVFTTADGGRQWRPEGVGQNVFIRTAELSGQQREARSGYWNRSQRKWRSLDDCLLYRSSIVTPDGAAAISSRRRTHRGRAGSRSARRGC
jgi:photosystem II stability/assembly factor-like uncharacterized protein